MISSRAKRTISSGICPDFTAPQARFHFLRFFRFAYSSVNHTTKGRLLTSFCCGFYLHMRDSKQRWGTEGFCKARRNKFVQIALQNPRRAPFLWFRYTYGIRSSVGGPKDFAKHAGTSLCKLLCKIRDEPRISRLIKRTQKGVLSERKNSLSHPGTTRMTAPSEWEP